MQAPDPAAKLAELLARPLVKVCGLTREEDVAAAADAGADLAGFVLAKESPRRADAVLDVPDTMLAVAVWVGEAGESPAHVDQLYERDGDHRSRDAVLLRDGEPVGSVLDLPWQDDDSEHWRAQPPRPRAVSCSPAGSPPTNVRAAIDAVRAVGGRCQLARSSSSPGSRITTPFAPTSRPRADERRPTAPTAAATSPRR